MPGHRGTEGLPRVLQESMETIRNRGLEFKGIFRVSPNMQQLRMAKELYERDEPIDLADYGPAVAAGLIKSYLRDMPEPIFPKSVIANLPTEATPRTLRSDVLPRLESAQTRILVALTSLLHEVDQHSDSNGMDAANLATLIAPNTVRIEDPLEEMKLASVTKRKSDQIKGQRTTIGDILVTCIEEHDRIFG